MRFGFLERCDQLCGIRTHGDLGNVDIVIHHGDAAQVLLRSGFAGVGELRDSTDSSRLGGLPAGVGVDLGVDDEDVHIDAGGKDMVEAAVADVVGPAVAAIHPHGLLHKRVGALLQPLHVRAVAAGSSQRGFESFGYRPGLVRFVALFKPGFESSFERFVAGLGESGFRMGLRLTAHLFHGEVHAHGILGVVLKQRVGRRGTVALLGRGIREGRGGGADNVGAAGGVGNIHPLAEELGHQLHVRRLAAAGAGAVELVERALELASLDGELVHWVLLLRQIDQVIPVGLFVHLALQRLHDKRFLRRDAGAGAGGAALAVDGVDLDAVDKAFEALAFRLFGDAAFRRVGGFFRCQQEGTDRRVRTYE